MSTGGFILPYWDRQRASVASLASKDCSTASISLPALGIASHPHHEASPESLLDDASSVISSSSKAPPLAGQLTLMQAGSGFPKQAKGGHSFLEKRFNTQRPHSPAGYQTRPSSPPRARLPPRQRPRLQPHTLVLMVTSSPKLSHRLTQEIKPGQDLISRSK